MEGPSEGGGGCLSRKSMEDEENWLKGRDVCVLLLSGERIGTKEKLKEAGSRKKSLLA